ncbi:MAG: amidase family protein, partial [Candidatus Omnitrophica bacterium]|nr:amidase family protein [Candidatus Omnitrophota bacterium]
MQNSKLNQLTAHELIKKLEDKEITAEEILIALKKRIEELDSKIRAYVRLKEIDKVTSGPGNTAMAPLKGLPITIKDNICTEGINTECCSKILMGFKPPYDATVIKKLKEAGVSIF